MIHRLVTASIAPFMIELRMLSFSKMLNNGCKTFLFRSRLPQTNIQSPYADPMRSKIDFPIDEVITIKDLEENIVPDLSSPSVRSFIKSTISTKKFSSGVDNKKCS